MTTTIDQVRDTHRAVENVSQAKGAVGALRVAELIDQVTRVHTEWLNTARARMLADAHYMGGKSMRGLATELDKSPNAVSLWIKQYGPKQYVTVRQDGEEFVIELAPAKEVAQLMAAGRRVAPSMLGLYDNEEGLLYDGSAQDLWHQLASQD